MANVKLKFLLLRDKKREKNASPAEKFPQERRNPNL
jgi:hypothetical protein